MAKQLGFYFNASICIGCKACQTACADKNDLTNGILFRRVFEYGGGDWVPDSQIPDLYLASNVHTYAVSTACMHCEQPICVDVCPTGAITKGENGVVLIDKEKCIGCRYCEWACPYGAPQFNEAAGYMTKCDLCNDLLAKGENPACTDACVMRALEVGELDELRAKYGNVNAIEPLPIATITEPALVITPHKNAQLSGMGTGKIQNLSEEV